jgi:plastocyanin
MRTSFRLSVLAVLATAAACGGGDKKAADSMAAMPMASSAGAPSGDIAPQPGGKKIEITMTTDDKGNYFTPKEVTANPGDVLHFKLAVGVHNVHFLPDSNPGKANLPPVSPFLQLPGQTHDIAVNFGEGTFYFQCDPHAALGMQGHLTVVKK